MPEVDGAEKRAHLELYVKLGVRGGPDDLIVAVQAIERDVVQQDTSASRIARSVVRARLDDRGGRRDRGKSSRGESEESSRDHDFTS